ncbi:MAG: hypothetical protein LBP67_02140 [Bacteroidales bacterium]|jgi:hypothetical protein|nr:hypothetical protein [Bacteroidales bacterium]
MDENKTQKANIKTLFSEKELEQLSSAFTLSDMEIFIFPELFYPLVISNIMSPILWEWAKDSWFDGIEKRSVNYRINRIKQYIMDNTVFNLDLDTWGLTTKEREIERFSSFIDMDALRQSNALFGYEGDKYYFSIDIRRHFGLDKYDSEVIPYWKTETIEAMMAFKNKPEYNMGAGECVSLVTLYAAALFVIGKIPLEKIFLIATPLHSQGFIAEKEGFLTNNRRLVTKKMWFNATELSAKARRAIENEKITIVSHITGYIHTFYKEATIFKSYYQEFTHLFTNFLHTKFNFEIFINYIRTKPEFWDCFQYKHFRNGKECYIDFKTIYKYQLNSKNSLASNSKNALFEEMDPRDFHAMPDNKKILINIFEDFLNENPHAEFDTIKNYFYSMYIPEGCSKMDTLFDEIEKYINVVPDLPGSDKEYIKEEILAINPLMTREEIISYVRSKQNEIESANFALYVYRDMDNIAWEPFIKAVFERNPVSVEALRDKSIEEIHKIILDLPNKSIYSEGRLAQPDEVWNFQSGNGLEKCFLFLNVINAIYN